MLKPTFPDSVIMPEATIAEGDKTVNIPIRGGTPGEGNLSSPLLVTTPWKCRSRYQNRTFLAYGCSVSDNDRSCQW